MSLGIDQYLWIDSLCIVQDDTGDWKNQAAKVAAIYGGSALNLSALSSADGSQGCRIQERDHTDTPLSLYADFTVATNRIGIFEQQPVYWHREFGDNPYRHEGLGANPLRTRAWTFQER